MKKILFLLMLTFVAAPVFAQETPSPGDTLSAIYSIFLPKNVETAVSKETDNNGYGKEQMEREVATAYEEIAKVESSESGVLLAHLFKLASAYEFFRSNKPEIVPPFAEKLANTPFKTKDGKEFLAVSFLDVYIKELGESESLQDQFGKALGFESGIQEKAQEAVTLLSAWKDHISEDSGNVPEAQQETPAAFPAEEAYQNVSDALSAFRASVRWMEKEDTAEVVNQLVGLADVVFAQYATNKEDITSFTPQDAAAFETIKVKLNERIKVGWQREPFITIPGYLEKNKEVVLQGKTTEEEIAQAKAVLQKLKTFFTALTE